MSIWTVLQAGEPYVYAGDDPVNEWDPKGLLPKYVGANGPSKLRQVLSELLTGERVGRPAILRTL